MNLMKPMNAKIKSKKLSGNSGVWLFIFIEMAIFALLFLTYFVLYQQNPTLFDQYKAVLRLDLGIINTIMLLTASVLIALAVKNVKTECYASASRNLWMAILCGMVYLFIKAWEWQHLYGLGYSLHSNTFFSFYFFLTVFHWLHVILALIILNHFRSHYQTAQSIPSLEAIESAANYWHMIDLLWLILFLLIYIL